MAEADEANRKSVEAAFQAILNRHGYVFQHSILVHTLNLSSDQRAPWIVPAIEFPVESQGYGTRIDLILKHRMRNLFLVCECKRVNPAMSNWVFSKSAAPQFGRFANTSYYEVIFQAKSGEILSDVRDLEPSERIYHVAVEVPSHQKGDPFGSKGRGDIEDACGQICRGMNGFANFFASHPQFLQAQPSLGLLPVIFTTATIWKSEADIGAGDLLTGNLDLQDEHLDEIPWLFYHYNQSPGLKHSLRAPADAKSIKDAQHQEFTRPIAIVSAKGIDAFLTSPIWSWP
jgi:hypothetical protein